MFNKTTSYIFNRYGEIVSDISSKQSYKLSHSQYRIKEKSINSFYIFDCDVIITVNSGIVMLIVSLHDDKDTHEKFVIHRTIKIKAGVRFNFISISANSKVDLGYEPKHKKVTVPTPDDQVICYEPLVPLFQIKEIYGYYYQVRNSNYTFDGEQHNYWELTFIDNGSLETKVDGETYELNEMDLILYAPGQFHSQWNASKLSCSYLTILFDMDLSDDFLITNRVYHAQRALHRALNDFIKVSTNDMLYDNELMLCYLKELIIRVMQYDFLSVSPVASSPMQQKFESEILNEIIIYISDNIYEQLTIEEVCHKFSISRSSLQTLFKNNLDIAPKHYISNLKLTKSKLLIKESVFTISEISAKLGFASIHYFSRRFKQEFGITPSDYAKTIYN